MGTNWKKGEGTERHQEALYYCEGDWAMAQLAHGGSGVSLFWDIQKQSGHSPEQPALGDPT